MSTPIERRLNKLEEIRDRHDVESDVDLSLERMGTTRAEMLADFGSLIEFRDWLAAVIDDQAGVTISKSYRQRKIDSAVSEKWKAIFDQYEAQTAACFSHPKEVQP